MLQKVMCFLFSTQVVEDTSCRIFSSALPSFTAAKSSKNVKHWKIFGLL